MASLKILIVEDQERDAALEVDTLEKAGYRCEARLVQTRDQLLGELESAKYDLILADYTLANFDGLTALRLYRDSGIDIPFIFVSGSVGEELAIEALKSGATDYVLKPNLSRLAAVVERALSEKEEERQQRRAERALRASEERARLVAQATTDAVWDWDLMTGEVWRNDGFQKLFGYPPQEISPQEDWWAERIHPDEREGTYTSVEAAIEDQTWLWSREYRFRRRDGSYAHVFDRGSVIRDGDGRPVRMIGAMIDITQRKLAEERLTESENRLRAIVESEPECVKLLSAEGRLLDMNAAGLAMLEAESLEEARSRPVIDYVAPEYREAFVALSRRGFGGEPGRLEFEIIGLRGTRRFMETHAVPLRNAKGEVTALLAVSRDVTERRLAEEALKERVRMSSFIAEISMVLNTSTSLRGMLQNCAQAMVSHLDAAFGRIWLLDPRQDVLELQASAGMYTHLDGPHSRIPVGKYKIGLIAQEGKPHLTNSVVGDSRVGDQEWAKREGMVAFAGYPLIVDGRVVGVMAMFARQVLSEAIMSALGSIAAGIAQGIERKRAEESLSAAEMRYRDLFENANDMIYTHDLKGRFTSINKSAEVISGYTREEALGMALAKVLAPEYFELSNEVTRRQLAGEIVPAYEVEIITKKGRRLPVEVSSRVLYDGPRPVGVQGIARDISERKGAEAERRRLEDQLLQAQKMESIGRLAGGIAHDFNNLLTAIIGYSQLLLAKLEPNSPLRRETEEITKAGQRAAALTSQLLAFSRRQKIEPQTINLNETIANLMKMLRRIIGEDIDVRVELAPHLPPASADPVQIEQVIMNLAINARDAMPDGGRLDIETHAVTLDQSYCSDRPWAKPGNYVQIVVRDTGEGIDAEAQQHLFEPFFTTKAVGKGTGLGLAVVYGIVTQHEGLINLSSQLGRGTIFEVYIPVTLESAPRPEEAPPQLRGGDETILVAEDEEALQKLLGDLLGGLGYRVLTAQDGLDALELYRKNADQIDLAMLDLVMPRMNGRECYEHIRASGGDLPVLFMTGYGAEVMQGALEEQVRALLIQKPYSVSEIGRRVREALDGQTVRSR